MPKILKIDGVYYFEESEQEKQQRQREQDKELIIADLMMQNAELQLQINDISLILADLMTGGKEE